MTSATASRPRSATYTRPWMADYQTAAVFNPARYAVVAASTKSGKTVACLVWLLEQAMRGRGGQNFWWIAPVYRQAEIAYGRMKLGLPRGLFEANETQLRITLANGTLLWFKSAEKPDNLFVRVARDTAHFIGAIVDESASEFLAGGGAKGHNIAFLKKTLNLPHADCEQTTAVRGHRGVRAVVED